MARVTQLSTQFTFTDAYSVTIPVSSHGQKTLHITGECYDSGTGQRIQLMPGHPVVNPDFSVIMRWEDRPRTGYAKLTVLDEDEYSAGAAAVDWGDITGTLADQTDLNSALSGKAASTHSHPVAQVTDLQTELDSKAGLFSQTHVIPEAEYTLLASDNGKVLVFSNAGAITLNVPSGLLSGFNCLIVQTGAGQVTPTAGGGVTIGQRQSYTKTAGDNAVASLIAIAADTFVLTGDLE